MTEETQENRNRRHPRSNYRSEYPYNQSVITRSGHEIHLNDTPGNESIRIAHTKGTYVEIEKSGRWVQTVVEKVYQYFRDSVCITVESHYDKKIKGTRNLNVEGDTIENYKTNKTTTVGQNLIDSVGGSRIYYTAEDRSECVDGNRTSSVNGSCNEHVEGDKVSLINGVRTDILNSDWSLTGKDVDHSISNNYRISCNDFTIDAQGNVLIKAGGNISIIASGDVIINGATIKLN